MNNSITDVASYLAARIPTGATTLEDRVSDWRATLRNAKLTRAMRPLRDLVRRSLPGDEAATTMCDRLTEAGRPGSA